jgi:hypothetical protein
LSINPNVRNVAIVALIALAVAVIPGGGTGSQVVIQALSLAFLGTIAWVASRMYREHRSTLYSLGDGRRAILYVAVGVATLTFTDSDELLEGGPRALVGIVLLAACAYAVYAVFRSAREY